MTPAAPSKFPSKYLPIFSLAFAVLGCPAFGTNTAPVGAGYTDVSPHQIVRDSNNYLYVVAPNGTKFKGNTAAQLLVWKGNQNGAPTSYTVQDQIHSPGFPKTGISITPGITTSASAIDGSDVIHSVWIDGQGNTLGTPGSFYYAQLNTVTGKWGAATKIANTNWTGYVPGDEGVALELDSLGNPHVFWTVKIGTQLRVYYANRIGGTWSTPFLADDATTVNAWHPTMAFAPNGDLLLAYIDGVGNYSHDGTVRTRVRHSTGIWDASLSIPVSQVYTGIDNGPSLLITPDGIQHITFCGNLNDIEYWYNSGAGWTGDQQPHNNGQPQITHDPALGPDGAGGLYIYGHGTPAGVRGNGANKYRFQKVAGETSWGPWTLVVTNSMIDDSTSTRWSQFHFNYPTTVDFTYWTHVVPNFHNFMIFTGTN